MLKYLLILSLALLACNDDNSNNIDIEEKPDTLDNTIASDHKSADKNLGTEVNPAHSHELRIVPFDSIPKKLQSAFKKFVSSFMSKLAANNFDLLMNEIHFPLKGEWAFVMGYRIEGIEGTKHQFRERIDSVFTPEIINNIHLIKPQEAMIKMSAEEEPSYTFTISGSTSKQYSGGSDESGRHFDFALVEDKFKLIRIWHSN